MLKKDVLYFAHPVNVYNKQIEADVMKLINETFPESEILNPNSEEHQRNYKEQGMEYFKNLVSRTNRTIILPFSNGTVGAGIYKEAARTLAEGKEIYFISPINFEITKIDHLGSLEALTVEETRARLRSGIEEKYGHIPERFIASESQIPDYDRAV